MWHSGDGMGWWMVFGAALWLVLWGTVIYLVVQATSRWGGTPPAGRDDPPVEIARGRYAAGEITKDEFDQLRHDLQGRPA